MASKDAKRPLEIGDSVAQRYEVVSELGHGGMGVVYLCYDYVADENVALKCVFLDKKPSRSKDAIWFQQEARALAALDHPNIVHARDFGTLEGGSPYLVMDAVHGRSVHVWKYLAKLPWRVTWALMDQSLAGLAHAHARGIIHGDLKPSNVMLDAREGLEEPQIHLLDLGLAWLLADPIDPRLDEIRQDAPAMPFGLGTPGWMAPEQIRNLGPHIGPATDLYALGSILYELLTGAEVFTGKPAEILRRHRDTPVDEFEVGKEVPPEVVPYVLRLLEKSPWKRFRYAADARREWANFRPEGSLIWKAPKVRFGDEKEDPAILSIGPEGGPTLPNLRLAPGLLNLRPTPLVGRKSAQELLESQIEKVVASQAEKSATHQMVHVSGEAGVGKSRLAEWLFTHVHEAGSMIPLRAHYRKTPGPLDGLRGAVVRFYNLTGQSRHKIEEALLNEWEVETDDEEARTWVAATSAWLSPAKPGEEDSAGPSGKRFFLDKPELRWVVIRYVLGKLAVAAGEKRSLMIWLDDLHHAPQSSFFGFQQLHREAAELPFLLVATTRDEAVRGDPEAQARLDELSHVYPCESLALEPLSADATTELLQSTLRLSPTAEKVARERSRGNPLFALQLVHSWATHGQLTLDHGEYTVPDSALDAVAKTTSELWDERLRAVDRAIRPAAYAVAALGEVMLEDVARSLLRRLNLDAEHCVSELQRAQIVVSEGGTHLRWPHALLQQHLFVRLKDSPESANVFRLAADCLDEHPNAQSRRIVRQQCQILLLAGEEERAARTLFAYIDRAWSAVRDVPATCTDLELLEGVDVGPMLASQKRWQAETARHGGNLRVARRNAEDARYLFHAQGEAENEAHCLRLLAHIASDQGVPSLARIEAHLAYDRFRELSHRDGMAQCYVLLGEIEYLLGEHLDAREHLQAAAETFRTTNDALGLSQCLILQSLSEQAVGRLASARVLLDEAKSSFDQIGYQLGLAQVDIALAHIDHRAGDLNKAYEAAAQGVLRFRELGNPRGEAASERLAAMAAFDRKETQLSWQHALSAYALYDESMADPWGRVEGAVLLAFVALDEEDLSTAKLHIDAAMSIGIDEAEPIQHRHLACAWYFIAGGDFDAAEAELGAARAAFHDRRRTADHTPQLLIRLAEVADGTAVSDTVEEWLDYLAEVRDRASEPPA